MHSLLRLEVRTGAIAVWRDHLVVIEQRMGADQVAVRDLGTDERATVPIGELRSRPLVRSDELARREELVRSTCGKPWTAATDREQIVCDLLGNPDQLRAQVVAAAAHLEVSRRTIYRWLKQYREAPQTTSLVVGRPGRPKGIKLLDGAREQIVDAVIRDTYLKRPRAKPEVVYNAVNVCCSANGLKPVSRKTVLARIRGLDPRLVARKRHGAKHARSNVDPAPGQFRVEGAGDVLQIDHTLADVHIVDEQYRQPIGRPWLTVACDVATRAIYGIHVSLDPPSSLSVALCLTHAVTAKEEWLAVRDLDLRWPMAGLPGRVHADNGRDLRGEALARGCEEYGIGLQFRPPARPNYGGHIERLIGTLMGAVHLLPGTTFSNPQERGDYPAEKQAVLTLREFERWLAIEICDGYHAKPHRMIGIPPDIAWERKIQAQPSRPVVGEPRRFLRSFLPVERRTFGRSGLQIWNIHYWSDVMPTLAHLGTKVIVRYDPRDLSRLYVLGPDRRYFEVPYSNLLNPPVTLWEVQAATRLLRAEGNTRIREAQLFKKIAAQEAIVAEGAATTKHMRRQRARQHYARHPDPSGVIDSASPVDWSKTPQPFAVERVDP